MTEGKPFTDHPELLAIFGAAKAWGSVEAEVADLSQALAVIWEYLDSEKVDEILGDEFFVELAGRQ